MSQSSRLVIISGTSGSGKSTALNAFEDLGFFCIDNLPSQLLGDFVSLLKSQLGTVAQDKSGGVTSVDNSQYALLVDCRSQEAVVQLRNAAAELRASGMEVSLVFVDSQDSVIVRRYQETRRPHPLLVGRGVGAEGKTLAEALREERELLAEFRDASDLQVDTSSYSPHELRRLIENFVGQARVMEVSFLSFGFKYGAPTDLDLLLDVRFLPNPNFVPELRASTGLDDRVRDYVFNSPDTSVLMEHYLKLLEFLMPRYLQEGKRYLTIGIGCTGGRHRSVTIAERLASEFQSRGIECAARHRDSRRE